MSFTFVTADLLASPDNEVHHKLPDEVIDLLMHPGYQQITLWLLQHRYQAVADGVIVVDDKLHVHFHKTIHMTGYTQATQYYDVLWFNAVSKILPEGGSCAAWIIPEYEMFFKAIELDVSRQAYLECLRKVNEWLTSTDNQLTVMSTFLGVCLTEQ